MGPDNKYKNSGAKLERDLDSLFFERDDPFWPEGFWEEEEEEDEEEESDEEEQ